ncbi:MAG TPA: FAD-binding protein, partial [Dehalococcoidia bacterium]|nr:FAD-binding protein [Dehalococcoidia bacterium]
MPQRFDYIIVGSGIAGLYAALLAREHGSVCVLTKGSIDECNTKYAQGGI